MISNINEQHYHLLRRAGFGVHSKQIVHIADYTPQALYEKIKTVSSNSFRPLHVVNREALERITKQAKLTNNRKTINQFHQAHIRRLTIDWLDEMANSEAPLREKLALFWHGHFACRVNNSLHQEILLNTIRKNALGSFKVLLQAVSKTAAMLAFLNNQQNKKAKPNENFAREVMELFTMGIGHYTEQDIKEAARAFTGWSYNAQGAFLFRQRVHDDGIKTVLGNRGVFTGDDILDILIEQRATAYHISKKLYQYLVNDKINEEHVQWLANRFYNNEYNIQQLLHDIFTSDWFYDREHLGALIKSPVELTTGIRRILPMEIQNEATQILLQRLLGQWLFNPPNVAGWPGGKAWIDSSSLLLRLQLPQLIRDNKQITLKPKSDDDLDMGLTTKGKRNRYQIMARVDWSSWQQIFADTPTDQLLTQIGEKLLPTMPASKQLQTIVKSVSISQADSAIEAYTLAVMGLPEYQMC